MTAYWDLINLGVCVKQQAERIGVEHEDVPSEGVVVRITSRVVGALGYIDRTTDGCADLDVIWTNAEVMEMLADIRRELTTDVEIRRQER